MTRAAQQALLNDLISQLRPVLLRNRIPELFECRPGLRLRRRYGSCHIRGHGQPPLILVRCTADGDRTRWRLTSAIVGTLLHELAHLRYRSHGRAFWRLCRALLDNAAALGVYDPADDDPTETSQGRHKLAGSAADPVLSATRLARAERSNAARQLVATWPVGGLAVIRSPRGRLGGTTVKVLAKRRTRLLVETRGGSRYFVNVAMLEPVATIAPSAAS